MNKKKHILFDLIKFPEYGGISTVTSMIIPHLLDLGYDVSIISHRRPNKSYDGPSNVKRYYTPDPDHLNSNINYQYYKNIIKNNLFDILILQDSYAPIHKMVCEIAEQENIKLFIFEHNSPCNIPNSRTQKPLMSIKGLIRRIFHPVFVHREIKRKIYLLEHAHKYVVLSNSYIDEFFNYIGIRDSKKVIAINNPTKYFNKVDLENKQNNVLFVGRLMPEKRVLELIKLWKNLDMLPYNFFIVGDGPTKRRCERFVKRNNIEHVRLEGFQNPDEYYQKSKVFWMFSLYEGWPMTLIEAMANGCVPIVLASFAAVYDIIDNGINGYIITEKEKNKFIEYTLFLFEHKEVYQRMAKGAINKANKFSINTIVPKWDKLLND